MGDSLNRMLFITFIHPFFHLNDAYHFEQNTHYF